MNDLYCFFVIFLIPFMLCVVTGLVYLLKSDWVWNLQLSKHQNIHLERTPEWETKVKIKGWFLTVGALLYLLYVIGQFFDAGLFFPA